MNIVFVISSLSSGGAERVLSILVNELVTRRYNITIITICKSEIFYSINKQINIIELDLCGNSRNKFEALYRNYNVIKILRKHFMLLKPNIIISFMNTTNILSIIANTALKSKNLISEHIDDSVLKTKFYLRFLQRSLYRYSDSLISVSKGVDKNFYFLNQGKRIVISNPIENNIDKKVNIDIDKINIEKYQEYIVLVGRLEKQKRYDSFIKAFDKIKNKITINALIIGDGSLRKELEILIDRLGLRNRIFLIGRVKNPYYFMYRAKLFILSSEYEGFGNVIIEAMACGTPVISFDCPSGPAEIIENEKNGILVENQNIEELGFQIERLINDKNLRDKLSKEAIKVKEKYNIDKIANQWEEIIYKVVNEND